MNWRNVTIKDNFGDSRIGRVNGVHVWPMPTHTDIRGRLFKAYTSGDVSLFPVPFNTYEHFFTESQKHVFRGMHFQGHPHEVSKIISIVKGKAVDFLFDMRKHSKTFGNLQIVELDHANPVSIFIPTGVAHGYLSLEQNTVISYRLDGPFCVNCDGGFSGVLVADFLPIPFSSTIKSSKDASLDEYRNYNYVSECSL